jgi:predicted TIM-barrel fold metal-dependent hydrolase
VFDGHSHLDKRLGSASEALRALHRDASGAGVKGMILLNLPEEGYENEVVLERAKGYGGFFRVFPSLVPGRKGVSEDIHRLKALGAAGLKMHPRLHGYRVDSDESAALADLAGRLGMPIMIDGFPDGKNISLGNLPDAFARLAEKAPEARIAIGHAGGHRILDALMAAKYFKNLYLDLSYTLLYYRDASITCDIAYAIESIRGEKVFWGSDYPDRPYGETIELSRKTIGEWNLPEDYLKRFFEDNVLLFLGEK